MRDAARQWRRTNSSSAARRSASGSSHPGAAALVHQEIEDNEQRGRRVGELPDAALRGVDALEQRIKEKLLPSGTAISPCQFHPVTSNRAEPAPATAPKAACN
jgi:hypothetical protein